MSDIRRCVYCNKDSVIIRSVPMAERELCTLDCGHVCAYERNKGERMRDSGADVTCPACKKTFKTYIQGDYGRICHECKADFGIRNGREATEMLTLLMDESGDGIRELAERRGKESRQPMSTVTHAPATKIDPARQAEIVRMMTDYGVTTPLPDLLTKPTTYVIAKNGLFEVRDNDIARIVLQPKDVMGLTDALTPGVHLHLPPVPYVMLQQTVAFFRETCKRQKGSSEALVQIWWNRQDKVYMVHVPEQTVSGGSVNHRSEFDKENARSDEGDAIWLHVMDIHSHGSSMSAFWSGTDDGDERKAPEGRMFGVIGKVENAMPEWRWRMRTREGFIDLQVTDVFDVPMADDVPFYLSWKVLLQVSGEKDGVAADGRVRLLCPVDPFKTATCPDEWHAQVKGTQWSRGSSIGYSSGHSISMPMYIYVEKDGILEEFRVDAEGKADPVPTGKKVIWKQPRETGHVH